MRKEEVDVLAKLLTDLKDSVDSLESALKENNLKKVVEAKTRIMNLQMQIGKKI